ncbi:MAG TPA: MotA/TolQ/ExbB proton channel family protein [Burkholderiaceae bacterium]
MNSTESAFTFTRYWTQGDAISHAVAYALLAMSLVSWFYILSKALSAWRARNSTRALDAFWSAPTLPDGIALLRQADPEEIFTALARDGELAYNFAGATGIERGSDIKDRITRALRQAITRSTLRLESGQTLLASIGATAPFVGLLGTVWGIYHALAAVSSGGTVQIDKVAGPVGEALIMTAIGLAVAIPAVLAYNAFNRLNRQKFAHLDGFAHDLQVYLTSGAHASTLTPN